MNATRGMRRKRQGLVLSHPTPNANWQNLALAVCDAGWLGEFHTTLAWNTESTLFRYLPKELVRELSRRSVPARLEQYLCLHVSRELCRLLAQRFGPSALISAEYSPCSVDAVYRSLSRSSARQVLKGCLGVVAGEDGALELFEAAKRNGVATVLEMPTAAPRLKQRRYQEEAQLRPLLAASLPGMRDSEVKLRRKAREFELADTILVANTHVETSLIEEGVEAERICLVPYGCDISGPPRSWDARSLSTPLHIAYVGAVAQHKGLGYLLEAAHLLRGANIRITVMGNGHPCLFRKAYGDIFEYRPSCPHREVLRFLRSVDVLVLPSLSEGFGMVIAEAMAAGVPVIATESTCAQDLITNGVEGFIVPIRDPVRIAEKLAFFANNRDVLPVMGSAARSRAEVNSWTGYRETLRLVLGKRLGLVSDHEPLPQEVSGSE